jgi:CRISPR/Cas system-associated exonuclease Cas4 (RecB family)
MPLFICFTYSQIYIFNIEEKEMNDLIMDKPIETEKSINFYNRDINIPLKFKLHQKVYYPRITDQGKLLDIREYYIVRIAIVITGYSTSIDYHVSPYKEKSRGQLFRNGNQLFGTYDEALKYAKEQGYNVENI